jgi:hypothetical protein
MPSPWGIFGHGGAGVASVVAGTGISVNNTDPANPIVSNTGVLSVNAGNGIAVDNTDPQNPIVSLPTPNVIQGTDSTGGTATPTYNFAQSFTPDFRGVLVIASVTFSTNTPQDIVEVWLENDANPGVHLNGLTLQSAGDSLQSVTIQAIDSPTPTVVTAYRIFANNTAAGSVTVPPGGASVLVSGF